MSSIKIKGVNSVSLSFNDDDNFFKLEGKQYRIHRHILMVTDSLSISTLGKTKVVINGFLFDITNSKYSLTWKSIMKHKHILNKYMFWFYLYCRTCKILNFKKIRWQKKLKSLLKR